MELRKEEIERLIAAAADMRKRSYAPYSHYHVGAALLIGNGQIYTGCNIENAAYTPTICAERTAIFKAVSEGERDFRAIAVIGGAEGGPTDYASPCGVCRQVMREFCSPETFPVILAKNREEYVICTLAELLPRAFGPEVLNKASVAALEVKEDKSAVCRSE